MFSQRHSTGKFVSGFFVSLLVAVAMIGGLLPASTAQAAVPKPSQTSINNQLKWAKEIAQIFDDHNVERVRYGKPKLALIPAVAARYAQPWTDYMASSGNFDHNDMMKIGWEGSNMWSENIALMYNWPVVDATGVWMDSTVGHRENMLDPQYLYVAIGVTQDSKGWNWSTTNFYDGHLRNAGKVYKTGAAWLKDIENGVDTFAVTNTPAPKPEPAPVKPAPPVVAPKPAPPVVAPKPVQNTNAGASLYMTPGYHKSAGRDWRTYCETYSSTVTRCWTEIKVGNKWVFNNLTYLPSPRVNWANNPLGNTKHWTAADGKQWRTECDTAVTGKNGCRSYTWVNGKWVFNNIVMFGTPLTGVNTTWRP